MRYVVLPQAFRNMLPVLLNRRAVQDTSLVYVLSIPDFLARPARWQRDGRLVEMYRSQPRLFRDFLSCILRRPPPAARIAIVR
jgi:ABC-type amino acid transport system permease subunit